MKIIIKHEIPLVSFKPVLNENVFHRPICDCNLTNIVKCGCNGIL